MGGSNADEEAKTERSVHELVELARKAVEAYVLEDAWVTVPERVPPDLPARAGVFVCIKSGGRLRGCIGTFEPCCANVFQETVVNAISAAMRDPRFPPVTPAELPGLSYSVDVLTPPEYVSNIEELDPRRYGVIVSQGGRRGLLLPDLEGVETVADQLAIAREKAGIPPGVPAELQRFEVRRYQ